MAQSLPIRVGNKPVELEIALERLSALSGRLFAPDGKPLAKTKVMLWHNSDNGLSALTGQNSGFSGWGVWTDNEGKFTMEELFAPNSTIFISAPRVGYASLNLNFPVGQDIKDLNVRLRPWRAITVRVVDKATRAPLPGVVVEMRKMDHERAFTTDKSITDRSGVLRLTELTDGWHRVLAGTGTMSPPVTKDVMLSLPQQAVTVAIDPARIPYYAPNVARMTGRLLLPDGKAPLVNEWFHSYLCEPTADGKYEQRAWTVGRTAWDGSFYLSVARGQPKQDSAPATQFVLSPDARLPQPFLLLWAGSKGYALLPNPPLTAGKKVEDLRMVMTAGMVKVERRQGQPPLLERQPALKNAPASKSEQQPAPTTGKVLFADDFRDSSLAQWQKGIERDFNNTPTLNVEVADGVLRLSRVGVLFAKGTEGLRDYAVEVVARTTPSHDALVSLLWRAQPPTARGYGINEKGYSWQYETDEGGFLFLASPQGYPRDPQVKTPLDDKWHTLRVECVGSVHRCYFDGKLIFKFTDTRYPTGGVGLSVMGGTLEVKSVKVVELLSTNKEAN